METTAALEADDTAGVLAAMRQARATADREEARILDLAATWAELHAPESLTAHDAVPAVATPGFGDRAVSVAGPGAPSVAEFCVAELAAVLRLSTDAGRSLLGGSG
jgi:hypothetical protein